MTGGPIDASLCLAGRDLVEPRPSPDGAWVLVGVKSVGRSGFVLVPTEAGPERTVAVDPPPTLGRGFGGGASCWLPDSSGFVYVGDGQVWVHRLDGQRRCLTNVESGREVQSPVVSPDGRHVAFTVDLAEVCVVALEGASGAVEHRFESHDFVMDPAWAVGVQGQARDSTGSAAPELFWVGWDVPHMPWDSSVVMGASLTGGPWRTIVGDHHAGQSTQVQQVRPHGDALWYVRDTDGWLNVHRNGSCVLAERFEHANPTWGPGQRSFAVSPDGRRVALNRNEQGFGRLLVVDLDANGRAAQVHEIGKGVHGQLHWVGDCITALRTGGRTPTQVVAYRESAPGTWTRSVLAVGPSVEWAALEHHLVEPECFTVTYMDTVVDVAVSVPVRAYRPERQTGGVIVWVHGGPTDQWQVTFMPRISYWVSRGWSVVVPDHRGSTGHGRAFQQSLRHAWGMADMRDVAAVIEHVQQSGWCTPANTLALGGSAGGYVALRVLEQHPERLAGAAVVYPVIDPVGLIDSTHRFEAHYTDTLVDVAAVREHRTRVAVDPLRIARPVLVIHGDSDPVVPALQSQVFAEQSPWVELVVYPGEGHGFRRYENQLDEYRRIEQFIDRVCP